MIRTRLRRVLATVTALVTTVAACGGDPADRGSATPIDGGESVRYEYGTEPDNFGDLTLPDDAGDGNAVVVLIHGGFWRDQFALDLMEPLVPTLVDAGFAVWNIEYRRLGGGGGYPETFDDVAAAIDYLPSLPDEVVDRLDLDRVATVGHSAGGHLAVWLASRPSLPVGVPGADPAVVPTLAVSQAGVLDLVECVEKRTGARSCEELVGALPDEDPERYAQTSPIEMLPIDAEVYAVHGTDDPIVPTAQSERYIEASDTAVLDLFEGAAHFSVITPDDPSWLAVLDRLAAL